MPIFQLDTYFKRFAGNSGLLPYLIENAVSSKGAVGCFVVFLLLVNSVWPVHAAPGSCFQSGTKEITCTGDHSEGIASGQDFPTPPISNTLNINSLTTDIQPSPGVAGISMVSATGSDLTVTYDGQQKVIQTQGEGAHGLIVDSQGGRSGSVSVSSNGDIITNGTNAHGIMARSIFLPGGDTDEPGDDQGDNDDGDDDDDHPGQAGEDHGKAGEDHGKAGEDHGKAGEDHGKAGEDHGKAGEDHGKAGEDHGKAGENHGKAGEDHGKAGEDHGKAGEDHGKAGEDHGKAGEDHGKAGEDHGKAGEDHGKAGEDHGKAGEDHGKAGDDHGKPGDDDDHGNNGGGDDDTNNDDGNSGRGTVTVNSDGNIVTRGFKSHAIIAQSLSDNRQESSTNSSAGSGGNGNKSGGNVHVIHTGTILTEGDQSHGIVAQSHGHAGGVVNVNVLGDVIANGAESDGIVAESLGSRSGGGNIIVIVDGGIVQGGTGSGAGVRFSGGADNLLTNRGAITTLNGSVGTVVIGTGGNETVENYGTLVGGVDLGSGNNALNNQEGAVFSSGNSIYLGNGNKMVNKGTLAPGGSNKVATSAITGNFEQTDKGTLAVDVDFTNNQTDQITVSGSADLAGQVLPNPVFENGSIPGNFQTTLLSAAGGVTDSGLGLSFQKSAVIDYQLLFPNETDVVLHSALDFSPSGLNANQTSIGNYINNIQIAGGSSGLAPLVTSLLSAPDVSSLAAIYDQLTPEVFVNRQNITMQSNQNFSNALRSCRQHSGEYHFVSEGECKWLRFLGRRLDSERTRENLGFSERAFGVAGGIQKSISKHYFLGFGLSFEASDTDSGNGHTNGKQFQGGVILKGRYSQRRIWLVRYHA
jgi:hypothetical protein